MTLRRVPPPPASVEFPAEVPYPALTAGVYDGLEALVGLYEENPRRPDDVHFWRLVLEHLHAATIASLNQAKVIAVGLDDLAYHYDARGWRTEAVGWRQAARVVLSRGYQRERQSDPSLGFAQ